MNTDVRGNMIGCSISPAPFTSMHWEDTGYDLGVIAGGMQDGFITLWNPSQVIESYSNLVASGGDISQQRPAAGCVSAQSVHSNVPVRALEFNPNKKNLLASGGSEVFIQDISSNIKKPQCFKPGEPNFHESSRITAISWNRCV
jgi:protein transport protein SEC31